MRTPAALGDEGLALVRVVDRAEDDPVALLERDRHREDRHAVGVIGRAVEWVDDPAAPGAAPARAALLGENRVVGKLAPEAVDDDRLRAPIHLGHEVDGAVLRLDPPRPPQLLAQHRPRGLRELDRDGLFR